MPKSTAKQKLQHVFGSFQTDLGEYWYAWCCILGEVALPPRMPQLWPRTELPPQPWPQLRLDLLHKARLPWADKAPLLFGSGVVNSYHNSIGVRTRHRLRECGGPRLRLHFHRLIDTRCIATCRTPYER